jgi:hypothetical protein
MVWHKAIGPWNGYGPICLSLPSPYPFPFRCLALLGAPIGTVEIGDNRLHWVNDWIIAHCSSLIAIIIYFNNVPFLRVSSYAGAVFGLPLSAWLVSYVHWSTPFYIYGIAGVVWAIFWFSMTFEKPAFHPTISAQEKHYIEQSIGNVSQSHPTVFIHFLI